MVSGPGPAAYYFTYRALKAALRDLPEDFVARVEAGLDEETRLSLHRGVQAARAVTRLRGLSFYAVFTGSILILGGWVVLAYGIPPGWWILDSGFAGWGLAVVLRTAAALVSLRYRRDVRRLEAFVRAAQGSSLARDLA